MTRHDSSYQHSRGFTVNPADPDAGTIPNLAMTNVSIDPRSNLYNYEEVPSDGYAYPMQQQSPVQDTFSTTFEFWAPPETFHNTSSGSGENMSDD